MVPLAWALFAACGSPAATPAHSPAPAQLAVEEIEGEVAAPGPQLGATAEQQRAAGDYYYRTGELARAREHYAACSGGADGELRAACQWAIGATLVAEARRQVDKDVELEQQLGLRPRPRECTPAFEGLVFALSVLRIAHRGHPTQRRAQVIASLEHELGVNVECRPPECPKLPYGWHRRSGEHEVHGSGLEGSSRDRIFACFGEPAEFSSDTWIYWQRSCDSSTEQSVETTVRLHFTADLVDRVTHERTVMAGACTLQAD